MAHQQVRYINRITSKRFKTLSFSFLSDGYSLFISSIEMMQPVQYSTLSASRLIIVHKFSFQSKQLIGKVIKTVAELIVCIARGDVAAISTVPASLHGE